ncbi:MAG: DUF937 domain-containing protein [Gammaproteobacteria bacterium]|nr:DUF937 domain-containing protein [Gammaproteobacteria bacterium]MDH5304153.1 DUF937 domain-containing protein [Gammaproteobacteria bacterium]MDH5321836.1 DUF937 domain-containing protein [Gammaproteobacteria bacterium]
MRNGPKESDRFGRGAASLDQLASTGEFSGQEMDLVVTAASPLLIEALHRQMKTPNGRNALRQLIRSGGPQQFIDRPFLLVANVGEMEGQQYLRQLLGSVGAVWAHCPKLGVTMKRTVASPLS